MDSSPYISFLTVNYRQPKVTLELIQSLRDLKYTHWELVVVNNDEEPCNDLREAVSSTERMHYVESGANLGFAGGNNVGLPHCKGDYVFFINNDTEVPPDLLDKMLAELPNWPKLGMMSPKILFHKEGNLIQYAGATPMSSITIRNAGIGSREIDEGQYDEVRETAFIHGAAMLVPKSVIEEVGPMYADFFLYYEELDWSARIARAGYSIVYNGKTHIWHKESVSTGVNSPLKVYYLTRNRLLFARRNYRPFPLLLAWLYFALVALPKNFIQWQIKGRPDLANAFLRGFLWNFTHR